MNFNGKYLKRVVNEDGECEITLTIDSYRDREKIKELEKDKLYHFSCTEAKSKRTIQQNKLMWELLHEINVARGGERATDDWEVYIEALERAGAKYEYISVLPKAEQMLKDQFRVIRFMNSYEYNGNTFNCYKVFYGSSKLDTKEMAILLETVLDMAAECDIRVEEEI